MEYLLIIMIRNQQNVNTELLGRFWVYKIGSIRISQKDKVMFSLVNCLQEVFIDATAALVERAGGAMGTSFTSSHLLNGKGCTKAFKNPFMPYPPSDPIITRF
jgi:hypothetical protein